jgi:predicted nuclease of predicted toxin-antitoxin system
MKFLCDVHISFKLVNHIRSLGYDVLHVNELPNRWYSTDKEIANFADEHDCILISKDIDFKNSFLINQSPRKLIKINMGNLSNQTLIRLVSENLPFIEVLNHRHEFLVELDPFHGALVTG